MDFLAKFSRLVNGMGQNLVLSWTKLVKAGNAKDAAETLQAVEAKVPVLLQLLVHEDDDISANVVGFCYEYLHVLKQVRRRGFSSTNQVLSYRLEKVIGCFCFLFVKLPQLTDQQRSNIEVSVSCLIT